MAFNVDSSEMVSISGIYLYSSSSDWIITSGCFASSPTAFVSARFPVRAIPVAISTGSSVGLVWRVVIVVLSRDGAGEDIRALAPFVIASGLRASLLIRFSQ